jgi:hypothetical protein
MLASLMLTTSMVAVGIVAYKYEVKAVAILGDKHGSWIHSHPLANLRAYEIGIIFGAYFFEYKKGLEDENVQDKVGYRLISSLSKYPYTIYCVCFPIIIIFLGLTKSTYADYQNFYVNSKEFNTIYNVFSNSIF